MAWKLVLLQTASSGHSLLDLVGSFFQVSDFTLQALGPFDTPLSPLTELEDSDPEVDLPLLSLPSTSIFPFSQIDFCSSIQVIETNFDPSLQVNITTPYPRDKDFDRYPLTQVEREKVSHAVIASSISDFSEKVCKPIQVLVSSLLKWRSSGSSWNLDSSMMQTPI